MTGSMADAISANYGSLPAGVMWAGYVTGPPSIQWTAAQLATAQVTIDQGSTGSPVPTANVRDVETGAWTPASAVVRAGWTAPRPTIYCDQDTLPQVLADGWQGCLWLAIPGWLIGQALPSAPGCQIVAVQNQQDAGNGAYDLSVVLDPTWPEAEVGAYIIQVPAGGTVEAAYYLLEGGKFHHIVDPTSLLAYQAAGIQTIAVTAAEAEQLVADFPPGQPEVSVGSVSVTFPTYTSTPEPTT